jgi:4-hydroxy-4-methyl-2-oxoglutarate aldolase
VNPLLASATVHEAAGRIGALPHVIKPVRPGLRIDGPAYTVLCGPGDNLALHHAIAEAPLGSVLVCQTGGWFDAGYIGDIMARAAAARGLAGLVIDACVRDLPDLAAGSFPVFARGLSIRGTTKDPLLAAALGVRLRFPDVDVDPGDLVIGDDDGVVVIAQDLVEEVLDRSVRREEAETEVRRRLDQGATTLEIYQLPRLDPSTTALPDRRR